MPRSGRPVGRVQRSAGAAWHQSSPALAKASAARTEANRAAFQAADLKNSDALTFNAWLATHPFTNPQATSWSQPPHR
jgi:hypothetical protein